MRVIVKASDKISKLWGLQKIKDTPYRLMNYTLSVEADEGHLLQNAMTGELVLLDNKEWSLVEQLPGTDVEGIQQLVEKYFIVPVDYDEHKVMWQLRDVLHAMEKKVPITGYTILPTTHCNARCFYCYESNLEHINMSEQTAIDLVDFIEKNHGDKPVHLGWFGGEPLVGIKRIDQICGLLEEKEIEFSSFMITNGYLFDEDTVKKAACKWKLKSLQITLDGTEEVYNQVKAYTVKDESPYKRVIRNIGLLLDADIQVSIRMNLDKHNHENLQQLIDELAERFGGRKGFSANVAALFQDCGFEPVSHNDDENAQIAKWLCTLNKRLEEKKLVFEKQGLPILRSRFCMADHDESVLVMPQGDLHKCDHHIDDYYVGNIYSGITETDVINEMKQSMEPPECVGCPLQPNCYHLSICKEQNHCKLDKDKEQQRVKNAMLMSLKSSTTDESSSEDDENSAFDIYRDC